jgi:hypothetical protein
MIRYYVEWECPTTGAAGRGQAIFPSLFEAQSFAKTCDKDFPYLIHRAVAEPHCFPYLTAADYVDALNYGERLRDQRAAERALVDAGYMPADHYCERWGVE